LAIEIVSFRQDCDWAIAPRRPTAVAAASNACKPWGTSPRHNSTTPRIAIPNATKYVFLPASTPEGFATKFPHHLEKSRLKAHPDGRNCPQENEMHDPVVVYYRFIDRVLSRVLPKKANYFRKFKRLGNFSRQDGRLDPRSMLHQPGVEGVTRAWKVGNMAAPTAE